MLVRFVQNRRAKELKNEPLASVLRKSSILHVLRNTLVLRRAHGILGVLTLSGIVFFKTTRLGEIVDFYLNDIGMRIWLEQEDCTILSHGNLLLGFCQRDSPDVEGMITFFYPEKGDVDEMYEALSGIATTEPVINERYEIYQFFAEDPEGRALEFQAFLHRIEPIEF